ncbi:MAG: NDP-sugar synthase [Acidobacteria bacterium]|nr:NDP-sugar synthase [Acidobacteriota bacterium]
MIPALVLTAGRATRLRPLSLVRAKAALPVAGEPLVRRILRQLQAAGVEHAVLNLHHLPHTIAAVVGDGRDLGISVRYSWEVPVLGSAGGPRQALALLGERTFFVVNGDTLTSVDIAGLLAEHRRTGALVTMAVVPNTQPDKYGSVVVDAGGIVTGFTRPGTVAPSYPRTVGRTAAAAPSHHRTVAPFHFIGVQVAEAEAFLPVQPGTVAESVADVYPGLMRARPGSVRAYATAAEFFDIGTPDDYLRTSLLLARREAGTAALRGARTRVDGTARVEDSVLWDDVEVAEKSVLRWCIVTDGVRVPRGTSWAHATLRRAEGELAPGERRIGELAVAAIEHSQRPAPDAQNT